jgi:hypothetical protein
MELQVTGCIDCPFCFEPDLSDGKLYRCRIVKDSNANIPPDQNYHPDTPQWCPLKLEPITITIKQQ